MRFTELGRTYSCILDVQIAKRRKHVHNEEHVVPGCSKNNLSLSLSLSLHEPLVPLKHRQTLLCNSSNEEYILLQERRAWQNSTSVRRNILLFNAIRQYPQAKLAKQHIPPCRRQQVTLELFAIATRFVPRHHISPPMAQELEKLIEMAVFPVEVWQTRFLSVVHVKTHDHSPRCCCHIAPVPLVVIWD